MLSQFRGSRTSSRVRAFAFVTLGKLVTTLPKSQEIMSLHVVFNFLGKLCLQNESLAKKCVAAFARELDICEDTVVRNNVIVIMCDLCIRFQLSLLLTCCESSCSLMFTLALNFPDSLPWLTCTWTLLRHDWKTSRFLYEDSVSLFSQNSFRFVKNFPFSLWLFFYTTAYVVTSGRLYQVERVALLPVCSLFGRWERRNAKVW